MEPSKVCDCVAPWIKTLVYINNRPGDDSTSDVCCVVCGCHSSTDNVLVVGTIIVLCSITTPGHMRCHCFHIIRCEGCISKFKADVLENPTRGTFIRWLPMCVKDGLIDKVQALAAELGTHTGRTCAEPSCGNHETTHSPRLKKCAGCLKVVYCGPDCQRLHWNDHKKNCKSTRVVQQSCTCFNAIDMHRFNAFQNGTCSNPGCFKHIVNGTPGIIVVRCRKNPKKQPADSHVFLNTYCTTFCKYKGEVQK